MFFLLAGICPSLYWSCQAATLALDSTHRQFNQILSHLPCFLAPWTSTIWTALVSWLLLLAPFSYTLFNWSEWNLCVFEGSEVEHTNTTSEWDLLKQGKSCCITGMHLDVYEQIGFKCDTMIGTKVQHLDVYEQIGFRCDTMIGAKVHSSDFVKNN